MSKKGVTTIKTLTLEQVRREAHVQVAAAASAVDAVRGCAFFADRIGQWEGDLATVRAELEAKPAQARLAAITLATAINRAKSGWAYRHYLADQRSVRAAAKKAAKRRR